MEIVEVALKTDSRKVKPGDTFIAIPNVVRDGHDYIEQAINNGAIKIIAEHGKYSVETIIVESTREYLKEYLYKIKLDCNILDKRKLVKYLMHMGYSSSIVDTYNKLIGKGQKYYISNIKLNPKEIIELVGLCGGRTVLAHPNTYLLRGYVLVMGVHQKNIGRENCLPLV